MANINSLQGLRFNIQCIIGHYINYIYSNKYDNSITGINPMSGRKKNSFLRAGVPQSLMGRGRKIQYPHPNKSVIKSIGFNSGIFFIQNKRGLGG